MSTRIAIISIAVFCVLLLIFLFVWFRKKNKKEPPHVNPPKIWHVDWVARKANVSDDQEKQYTFDFRDTSNILLINGQYLIKSVHNGNELFISLVENPEIKLFQVYNHK